MLEPLENNTSLWLVAAKLFSERPKTGRLDLRRPSHAPIGQSTVLSRLRDSLKRAHLQHIPKCIMSVHSRRPTGLARLSVKSFWQVNISEVYHLGPSASELLSDRQRPLATKEYNLVAPQQSRHGQSFVSFFL